MTEQQQLGAIRWNFYTAGGEITGLQNGTAIAGDFMSAASFLGTVAAQDNGKREWLNWTKGLAATRVNGRGPATLVWGHAPFGQLWPRRANDRYFFRLDWDKIPAEGSV